MTPYERNTMVEMLLYARTCDAPKLRDLIEQRRERNYAGYGGRAERLVLAAYRLALLEKAAGER